MNNALLAKLAWMVASKGDSLCMSILRAKYKVRNDWLRREPLGNTSPIWKAIEGVKEIIVKGACYLIGDGASINVWLDPWVPWIQNFIPKPAQPAYAETPLMVSMLIMDHPSTGERVLSANSLRHLLQRQSFPAHLLLTEAMTNLFGCLAQKENLQSNWLTKLPTRSLHRVLYLTSCGEGYGKSMCPKGSRCCCGGLHQTPSRLRKS